MDIVFLFILRAGTTELFGRQLKMVLMEHCKSQLVWERLDNERYVYLFASFRS